MRWSYCGTQWIYHDIKKIISSFKHYSLSQHKYDYLLMNCNTWIFLCYNITPGLTKFHRRLSCNGFWRFLNNSISFVVYFEPHVFWPTQTLSASVEPLLLKINFKCKTVVFMGENSKSLSSIPVESQALEIT